MTIAFPVTRPFVLAVQATGCACRGWTNGSRKRPWYETRSQPLPNSPHGSTLTFSKPHSRSFEAVHSFASRSEERRVGTEGGSRRSQSWEESRKYNDA